VSRRGVDDLDRRDTPARMRRDLALLWIDSRSAGATMKRRPDADVIAAPANTPAVIGRIEDELHGEARRYSSALWSCIAIGLMPFALAALGWSGMYWLPVRIVWYPFERGLYGLPWLSLYEWLAYLFLAAFFAYGFALISESRASTRRLSADYYRLVDADESARQRFAVEVVSAGRARTELVLRGSREFAEYPPLLDELRPVSATAEQDAG
jgi:hypothetical protein